jgi:hypothetical protein
MDSARLAVVGVLVLVFLDGIAAADAATRARVTAGDEHGLAMVNIADMLHPGGLLLSNNALVEGTRGRDAIDRVLEDAVFQPGRRR